MRSKFAALLMGCTLLAGCTGSSSSTSTPSLTSPTAPLATVTPTDTTSPIPIVRITGINGRLVLSPTGEVSVVDGGVPTGFRGLGGATVEVQGTNLVATADGSGYFEVPEAPPGLAHLRVLPNNVVLTVPSFSAETGPAVSLELFPPRLALVGNQTVALRAVGKDAQGRFFPLEDGAVSWELNLIGSDPPLPTTTALQPRALTGNVIGGETAGLYEVVARETGVSGRNELIQADPGATGAVRGQVLNGTTPVAGAQVIVGGAVASNTTDSGGNFEITGLSPIVTELFVYQDGKLAGTATVPLQADRLTVRNIPLLNQGYTEQKRVSLGSPTGLAVDGEDQVLVADQTEVRVLTNELQPTGTLGSKFSNASGVAAAFQATKSVVDNGAGKILVFPPTTTQKPLEDVTDPWGATVDSGGDLYVTSFSGDLVRKFLLQTNGSYTAGPTFGTSFLHHPTGLAASRSGRLYIADQGDQEIEVFSTSGTHLGSWKLPEAPHQVAVDGAGNVYVVTATKMLRYDGEGVLIGEHGPFVNARGIAVGPAGDVYVSDQSDVIKLGPSTPPTLPPPPLPAPTGTSLVQDANFTTMETAFQNFMQENNIPGGALAVSVNGRLVIHRGYGYATQSPEQTIAVQPDNQFRLASCSKSFAAVTLLKQLEVQPTAFTLADTVFQPGDKLAFLAPTLFDPRAASITVQHLLQMTAGLDDTSGLYAPLARTLSATPPATAVQILIHILTTTKLAAQPGTQSVYSDVAYMTIGRLVEAVEGTGESYGQILARRLLGPLGVPRVQVESTRLDGASPTEVSYYDFSGSLGAQSVFTYDPLIVPLPYGGEWDGMAHDSAGGLICSAPELLKLINAVAPNGPPGFNRPLSDATVAMMVAPPPVPHGTTYWGMGYYVTQDTMGNVTEMTKDGALPGTMTFVEYQAENKVAYAVLLNSRPGPSTVVSGHAIKSLTGAVKTMIAAENASNGWPTGDLFPTVP